ncbi:protein-ER retention protein [Mycoemilia scoparia]|uniref:Protein-ER retention protein n=1 Tax=Mycoemilia scoparia TaxID=417184 RepID=A0A9W8DT46_9FUNG|nr:protein-ER retention protein [Mycoemilia scoparia]
MFSITLFGFQPILLFLAAGFGWGLNIDILQRRGIDALRILNVKVKRPRKPPQPLTPPGATTTNDSGEDSTGTAVVIVPTIPTAAASDLPDSTTTTTAATPPTLGQRQRSTSTYLSYRSRKPFQNQIYSLCLVLGTVALAGYLWMTLVGDLVKPIDQSPLHAFCVGITYMAIWVLTIMPLRFLYHRVRFAFLASLWRIVKPSLTDRVFFCDILLADILTSCAKLLFELFGICFLFVRALIPSELSTSTNYHHGGYHSSSIGGGGGVGDNPMPGDSDSAAFNFLSVLEPVLASLPFLFRFRQCVNEYLNSPRGSSAAARHKANAIKYLSSLPVIFLARFQKMVMLDFYDGEIESDNKHIVLFAIWVFCAVFNSLYSFYWDIVFDWGLGHINGFNLASLLSYVFPEFVPDPPVFPANGPNGSGTAYKNNGFPVSQDTVAAAAAAATATIGGTSSSQFTPGIHTSSSAVPGTHSITSRYPQIGGLLKAKTSNENRKITFSLPQSTSCSSLGPNYQACNNQPGAGSGASGPGIGSDTSTSTTTINAYSSKALSNDNVNDDHNYQSKIDMTNNNNNDDDDYIQVPNEMTPFIIDAQPIVRSSHDGSTTTLVKKYNPLSTSGSGSSDNEGEHGFFSNHNNAAAVRYGGGYCHYMLRPNLILFPDNTTNHQGGSSSSSNKYKLYYFFMALNLLLRLAWTIKLSTYIQFDNIPRSVVYLNALEILRRWIWIFFRIEKEAATAH